MGKNLFSSFVIQREIKRMNKIKFEANKRNQIFEAEAYERHTERKCDIDERDSVCEIEI